MIGDVWTWLTDPAQWEGAAGIPYQLRMHLIYSFGALILAAAIAVPLGMYVGHTGRGRALAVNITGVFRAIPSLGVLFLASVLLFQYLPGESAYVVPAIAVLVLLAVPPILSGVYAGIEAVDPAARDAARGMGMTGWQVLTRVEMPCALPLVMSGIRSAMLQIIATATMAAIVSLDGLGRYLIDGQASRDYTQMAGGAVLVAVLALSIDLVLAGVQRWAVSSGLQTSAEPRRRSGGIRSRLRVTT